MGLNPYSNGIYSLSKKVYVLDVRYPGLNPYSNGIYSLRAMIISTLLGIDQS